MKTNRHSVLKRELPERELANSVSTVWALDKPAPRVGNKQ
jgi:hypothetical protein